MPASSPATGKKDAALAVLDKADEFSSGRLPIAELAREDRQGRDGRAARRHPVRGRQRASLDARDRAQPRRRRSLRAALSAICAGAEARQRRRAGRARRRRRAAGGRRGGDRALSPHSRRFAAEAAVRAAARPQPRRPRPPRRGDPQLQTLVDENPDDMRAYLALGGVYASKEDYPARPRSTTRRWRGSRRRKSRCPRTPRRRQLEHLLPARHRL